MATVFLLSEKRGGRIQHLLWSETREEVRRAMQDRAGELTRKLERNGEKVYSSASAEDRISIHQLSLGFFSGGDMVEQSVLSVREVPHVKSKSIDDVTVEPLILDAAILD
jgi:hypothetical protein